MDGTFPDYSRVISASPKASLSLDIKETSKILTRFKGCGARTMALNGPDGSLEGYPESGDTLTAPLQMGIDAAKGDRVGLTTEYLLSALKALPAAKNGAAIVGQGRASDPLSIWCDRNDDASGFPMLDTLVALMPCRV